MNRNTVYKADPLASGEREVRMYNVENSYENGERIYKKKALKRKERDSLCVLFNIYVTLLPMHLSDILHF